MGHALMALEPPYMGQPWASILLLDAIRALIDIQNVTPLRHATVLSDG